MVRCSSLIALLIILLPLLTNGQGPLHDLSHSTDTLLPSTQHDGVSMEVYSTPEIDGTTRETGLNRESRLVGNETDEEPAKVDEMLGKNNSTGSVPVKNTTQENGDGHDPTISPDTVTTTTTQRPTTSPAPEVTSATPVNPKFSSTAGVQKPGISTAAASLTDAKGSNKTTTANPETSTSSATVHGFSSILVGLVCFFLI
uniref:Uncharacterized protein n=1 Tax=Panagrolaimus superbus TaxID=310955 RepID=A0A914Y4P5_9BILA